MDISVSVGILTILGKLTNWSPVCQFAIKSGGHAPGEGEANIDQGVTIDLGLIRTISVSSDSSVVSVGPAARWGEVYSKLDAFNISVAGGRVSSVGVGGLTVGGKFGCTCEHIE